jgi:phosphoribosylaminoimidazolecarboxamide formyltransferase/IMP cyclohydrolase
MEAIEQIDIGGVALLRAAAKNFLHVAAVCRPQQYAEVGEALREGHGTLPEPLARRLAAEAFALTRANDQAIGRYLAREGATGPATAALPELAVLRLARRQVLRYGENPHQPGAWYAPTDSPSWGLGTLQQRQGKELSYNNLLDLDGALRCLREFNELASVIVKHGSQCGLARAGTAAEAYARAHACDPEAAFGGVVGVNRPIDADLARALTETFLEVVLAPAVGAGTEAIFARKPNLRVVTVDWPDALPELPEWRPLAGGWLAQLPDRGAEPPEGPRVATRRGPTESERADLMFAWISAAHVRSNGIVLARAGATVGIGQGHPSRVGSVRLSL